MRSFEFARAKTENGFSEEKAYDEARLPEYQTKHSGAADFFCAERVVVPSIWRQAIQGFKLDKSRRFLVVSKNHFLDICPTLVHTGIRAQMEDDEVLKIYSRSSGPKKLGLVLANSTGIIDKDYYGNEDNDGEIMFAFYNFKFTDVTLNPGDRIGQGMFCKVLRPTEGLVIKDDHRKGGFGSTDKEV